MLACVIVSGILLLIVFSTFYWAGAGAGSGNVINLGQSRIQIVPRRHQSLPDVAPGNKLLRVTLRLAGRQDVAHFWERWTTLFQLVLRRMPFEKDLGEWWTSLWNPLPNGVVSHRSPLVDSALGSGVCWLWTWLCSVASSLHPHQMAWA